MAVVIASICASAQAAEAPRPAAEAKGAKSPVELTLRVLETKIKQGDSLWLQLEIKNIGKSPMFVLDDIFYKSWLIPGPETSPTLYVEMRDSKGEIAKAMLWPTVLSSKPAKASAAEDKKVDAMIATWRKQGLNTDQINEKLLDYSQMSGIDHKDAERAAWNTEVASGDSRTTKPWAHHVSGPDGEPIQSTPRGAYSEKLYFFYKPGKYSIRAVYDRRVPLKYKKELRPDATNILVKTKPIIIEVSK